MPCMWYSPPQTSSFDCGLLHVGLTLGSTSGGKGEQPDDPPQTDLQYKFEKGWLGVKIAV